MFVASALFSVLSLCLFVGSFVFLACSFCDLLSSGCVRRHCPVISSSACVSPSCARVSRLCFARWCSLCLPVSYFLASACSWRRLPFFPFFRPSSPFVVGRSLESVSGFTRKASRSGGGCSHDKLCISAFFLLCCDHHDVLPLFRIYSVVMFPTFVNKLR